MDKKALDKLFGVHRDTEEHSDTSGNEEDLHHNHFESFLADQKASGDTYKELPVALLRDFATGAEKQPFRAYTPEQLESLKQNIIENGIIQPLIVRPIEDGRYEIISGHNRRTAAQEAGYLVVPCIVRNLSDEDAILQMVSTNLQQRPNLRPSEKAFAYRMQLEAMKRKVGRPSKENASQAGTQKRSDQLLAEQAGESRNQIQRYIRLTYLIKPLLDLADQGKIGLTIGETLSFLSPENQAIVENFFFQERKPGITGIDQRTADKLRDLQESGGLTDEVLEREFLLPSVRPLTKVSVKPFRRWFPPEATEKEMQDTILTALRFYYQARKESKGE